MNGLCHQNTRGMSSYFSVSERTTYFTCKILDMSCVFLSDSVFSITRMICVTGAWNVFLFISLHFHRSISKHECCFIFD